MRKNVLKFGCRKRQPLSLIVTFLSFFHSLNAYFLIKVDLKNAKPAIWLSIYCYAVSLTSTVLSKTQVVDWISNNAWKYNTKINHSRSSIIIFTAMSLCKPLYQSALFCRFSELSLTQQSQLVPSNAQITPFLWNNFSYPISHSANEPSHRTHPLEAKAHFCSKHFGSTES